MGQDKIEKVLAYVLGEEIMVSPRNKAEKAISAALIKAYRLITKLV